MVSQLQMGDDHNSSRPLAVLLTLDRPSRNPESVILEGDSKDTGPGAEGCQALPPAPTQSTLRASGPAHSTRAPPLRPGAHTCSICTSSSSS